MNSADSPPRVPGWRIERQISAAVIMAVAIQAGAALMWAGRASARIDALAERIEAAAPVAERLARLEEQSLSAHAALARIESKLDKERPR